MTGQNLFSLIQGLADLCEKMERIKASSEFRVTNDYSISGYEVEKIANLCWQAEQIINQTTYEPIRK